MRGIKRIVLAALLVVLVFAMPFAAEAAMKVYTSGVNYPVTLKKGQQFQIKGDIRTSEKMSKVVVSIYNSSGKICLQKYQTNPRDTRFDVKKADNSMQFERLAPGKYYYLISVFGPSGKKQRVVRQKFTIKAETMTIKKTNVSLPKTLQEGKTFAMKGTISANMDMKSITFAIYNAAGSASLQKYTEGINGTSYNIAKADPYIDFSGLKKGTYYYRITVANNAGKTVKIVDQKFTVTAKPASVTPQTPTETKDITMVFPQPDKNITIKRGTVYHLGGAIVGKYQLKEVKLTIRDAKGKMLLQKKTDPGSRVYILENGILDAAVPFEKMEPATYILQIVATDVKGSTKTVQSKAITIK